MKQIPESGVRSPDLGARGGAAWSRVRSPESGVRGPESGVRSPESGVRSPEFSVADLSEPYLVVVQNPESRVRTCIEKSTESPLSESKNPDRVRDPEKKYRHAPRESRIRSPDFLKL